MATRAPGARRTDRNRFDQVRGPKRPRSLFDLSHTHLTTMDSGFLYPLMWEETLPGDTFTVRPSFLARLASPLHRPAIAGIKLSWHAFWTPLRQLWDNHTKQHGEREDPDDHIDYLTPIMTSPATTGYTEGSLADYLGLPIGSPDIEHSALPFRNYAWIHDNWFRNENLQDSFKPPTDDGPDDAVGYELLRRNKKKDYATAALPRPQKGDPVGFSLQNELPVTGSIVTTGVDPTYTSSQLTDFPLQHGTGANPIIQGVHATGSGTSASFAFGSETGLEIGLDAVADPSGNSITVSQLRESIAFQRILELDARGGTRYPEHVYATFGVRTDDIRLMRPAVIGAGTMDIDARQVAQTSNQTTQPDELGSLAGYGVGIGQAGGFTYSCNEHGILMILVSIRTELRYQRFVDRRWKRQTRYDHFHPELAHLGEQPVYNYEIWADGTGDPVAETGDYAVWGYQPRWEEMRHRRSILSGDMQSDAAAPLHVWHTALDFETRPALNETFIQEDPPIERVTVYEDYPEFIVEAYFDVKAARPMPKFGTPGLMTL
jgi:hypothetical protein